MTILIVEDELLAVQKLIKLLSLSQQAPTVVGVTDGIESTVEWLNANPRPDLILMDIELSDGQSFEIFNLVQVECPVIFTTSFDEHSVESFRVNSLDYLLKPIKKEELEQALSKFNALASRNVTSHDIGDLVNDLRRQNRTQEPRNQLLAKAGQQLISINTADIAYFYQNEGITHLYSRNHTHYVVDYTLDALEGLLEPNRFFRVNSQFLVEARAILHTQPSADGLLAIDLRPRTEQAVLVSLDRINSFTEWIGQ
ncbi:response regulator transcription factor [Spirosoma taeanense]|uniref:Response regulator transcription factor n=1 Tax=Spirosoma taeanense TaxID=2735870 RepID=A0A6M5Y697_9BACT|nr:LytTR family DNA-binding domain-containing protein [Spirosoma taeanense]QJW89409.1 response regulator transcription factor [Spirosoma taeanense]